MSNPTQAFRPTAEATQAYRRATQPTWQQRGEGLITRIRDFYDALWDLMPAIAAIATLLWIINTVTPR